MLTWKLQARVVHSDVESSASLEFGGGPHASALNQLQSNIEWTQRDNLHSVPTDCNQRTERQGWMADASVSAESAWHNFAMAPFYRNWLRSIVDVQEDFPAADPTDKRKCGTQGRVDCVGAVADTVPHPPGTFGSRPADPSWSSSFDLVYWYLLRYSGDKRIANSTYPALKSYIEYMLSIAAKDSSGLLRWSTTGDWLEQQWPSGSSNYHVKVREQATSAFNTILGIKILADAAALLGGDKKADETKYRAVVADQQARWHQTFFNMSGTGGGKATEWHGRFVDPAQEAGSKNCPNGGICCPYSQFPGGCTFWQSFANATTPARLHMVSNCDAYPASCHRDTQRACWKDWHYNLQIHPITRREMRAIPLGHNFTCDMPLQGDLGGNASSMTYGDGSQAVLAYSLYLGVAPTPEIEASTIRQLVAAIDATGNHPTTGIIATKWLPEALSKLSRPEVVLNMVLQTGPPSWMDQIAHNATTVHENWEWFVGPGMNSHNHPALTSIGAWLWRWLAGIRIAEGPTEPGYAGAYAHLTLAPYEAIVTDHARISSAKASLPTTHGNISLSWEFSRSSFYINTSLPPNTAATVKLPHSAGRLWAELHEGESLIYRDGDVAPEVAARLQTVEGVHTVDRVDADHLVIQIGGGDYSFAARLGPVI